jgi:PAS domain S-box-containing protein
MRPITCLAMEAEMEHTADEIKRLQACINNLISVLALPAIWGGREPSQIVSTLLDVLLGMLRLDFAYARLSDAIGGGTPIEMVRSAHPRNLTVQPQEIGHALNPWLTGDPRTSPLVMPNLLGEGTVSIAPLRLGLQNEVGVLVAGSKRADFPTEIEMLLLRVAANQAGIGLQEARLLSEQRLAAEWLERRVVERTRRHAAVNEELRKEIIERKRIEEELRRSEAYLAEGQRLTHTGSWAWNIATRETVYWSDEQFRIFGFDPEKGSPSHQTVFPRIHPEDQRRVSQTLEVAIREKRDFELEHRIVLPDGTIKHSHVVGHPVLNESGDLVEFIGTNMDVTERKRVEESLREQASLLNLTHDSVFVRDMNDVITYWNRGAEELYGWTREEAVGKVSHQLTQTIFPAPLEEINAELLRTGRWEGELVHTKRDGTQEVVASRWSLQRDEQGLPTAILETNNDITERKRAEAELRESEKRYRHIFQTAGVSIWEEDFSQVKAAIDALKAQGVGDFSQYLAAHPEFIQQAISMVKIIDVNDATVKLFAAQSKDELLVSLHKIFLPEAEEVFAGELIAIAEGRTNFESETILQTLKGDKLTVLFTITFPRQPAKLNSVLVSIMDITERKRADEALHKTQAELAHVTRVATLGELTASIAHEVNQPLAAIVTNGNACLRWLAGDSPNLDEARETARRIIRDGNRAGDVIGRIRTLSRKTGTEKELLDMNQAIREVVALAEGEVRRNGVALRTELTGDLPPILGDRVELEQVVLNLIMNAIEAMSAIGDRPRELVIRTQSGEVDQVRVAVQDSGIGLDPQSMGRIFDAFYTTKPQGMGMGLAISRSIVENHGGRLWAAPNEGQGATFQFTLQAYSE